MESLQLDHRNYWRELESKRVYSVTDWWEWTVELRKKHSRTINEKEKSDFT
jgi:hypothetical protein